MAVYNDKISAYITEMFAREDEVQKRIPNENTQRGLPNIGVRPEEGRFLQVLVRACAARKAVEIGTLGGYSGIWIARGLADGGRLVSLELEAHHADVAREHFRQAGVANQVEVRVGDAHQLLQELYNEGPFDFVFIDAEKPGYKDYLAWAVKILRMGGVLAAHNAFSGGEVIPNGHNSGNGPTMHAFNQAVSSHPQLLATIYPGGDGMVVAVKVT